jgi:hypothetical protein
MAGGLAEGETMLYNGVACVYVRAGGTVEVRLGNGVAVPLATKADLDAVIAQVNTHVHHVPAVPAPGPTPVLIPTLGPSIAPALPPVPMVIAPAIGTTVLRGQ